MAVPGYSGIPWNAWTMGNIQDYANDENRQQWNSWAAVTFPKTTWHTNHQNYHLFGGPSTFSAVVGNNLNEIQSRSENLVTDQSMLFHNVPNENRLNNYPKPDYTRNYSKRKNDRKNWKRNRHVLDQITNTTVNLPHQRWNHTPEINWFQTNLPPRHTKANFQNPFRFGSYSKRDRNPLQSQNLPHKTFASTSSNISGFSNITKVAAPRAKIKSHNLQIYSGSNMGTTGSNALKNSNRKNNRKNWKRNRSTTIEKTKYQSNSNENPKNSPNMNTLNKEDDDITYLYTIDSSSETKMVLEIDLQSDSVNAVSEKFREAVNLIKEPKNEARVDEITDKEHGSSLPLTTRKRKLEANSDEKSNKRSSYQPACTACQMCYDDVIRKLETMYISSSCSHVICRPCISKEKYRNVCPACGKNFLAFRRLYL